MVHARSRLRKAQVHAVEKMCRSLTTSTTLTGAIFAFPPFTSGIPRAPSPNPRPKERRGQEIWKIEKQVTLEKERKGSLARVKGRKKRRETD
jgi:hypothetical protein